MLTFPEFCVSIAMSIVEKAITNFCGESEWHGMLLAFATVLITTSIGVCFLQGTPPDLAFICVSTIHRQPCNRFLLPLVL